MIPRFLPLLLALAAPLAGMAAEATRPNVILITVDDLGYADIGPFGSNNRTPHLDRLAREGRLLTSHYASPVCTPSRTELMTGSYAKRALPITHVLFPAAAVGLHPDEVTVAEVLKTVGYATACVGKWHLGDQPEFLPTRQGFDSYYGIPYSNDMGPLVDGTRTNVGKPPPTAAEVAVQRQKGKQSPRDETGLKGFEQTPQPLLENEKVIARVRPEEQLAVTRLYTEKAVAFIRASKDRPFFLYLPHTAVHFPLYPSEKFRGKSPNGLIGDWTEEVDWSVGQVLDAVRELGLSEKTLVIFTSDNGGAVNHGSNNRPLRGTKGQTYEGGIRVCTIASWPGRIPAGTRTGAITANLDILPTLARLAGAKLPASRRLDGVDIWPVLAGIAGAPAPREQFHYFRTLNLEAVRSGPWKLHVAKSELYHLGDDIGETKNVFAANPDVVRRLQGMVEAMRGDLGVEGIGPGCRPLGRVADPKPLIDDDGTVRPGFVASQARFP